MRLPTIIAALIILASCKDTKHQIVKTKEWTEEEKRKYFADSIARLDGFGLYRAGDSIETFAIFFKTHYPNIKARNYYDAFPYAFEEEYVDTTKIDTSKHWFRLIVRPCFRLPYCLVVEKKYGKSILTTKITDGNGCNYTGNLVISMKLPVDDTLYDNISNRLTELNFWQLPFLGEANGLDGETWTLESIENGKYNLISRWVPQSWGDSTTRELGKLGLKIRECSALDKVLLALGIKNGM